MQLLKNLKETSPIERIKMTIYLSISWVLVFVTMIGVAGVIAFRRRQQKKMLAIYNESATVVEGWFIGWLSDQRLQTTNLIDRATPISPDEIEDGIKAAIHEFGGNFLRSTDIDTAGEFIDMIQRQLRRESRRKRTANSSAGN